MGTGEQAASVPDPLPALPMQRHPREEGTGSEGGRELLNVARPKEVFLDQLVDELPSHPGTGSESQEDWQAGEETAQKA